MKIFKKERYQVMAILSKYGFVFVFIFILTMPTVFLHRDLVVEGSSGVNIDAQIKNPLGDKGPQDIPSFIEEVINIVLIVGIPILVLAIIYAGFLYVKAQGNPTELEVAHKTLLYTVIGGALLLGAFVIANAIGQTVKEIGDGVK